MLSQLQKKLVAQPVNIAVSYRVANSATRFVQMAAVVESALPKIIRKFRHGVLSFGTGQVGETELLKPGRVNERARSIRQIAQIE